MQCYGAERTLAAPSGHTARASFVTAFLFLDLFFASTYSRVNHSQTNQMSLQTNRTLPVVILVGGLIYFSVLAFFVFMSG